VREGAVMEPTIIKDFPSGAVEAYRKHHGGMLPSDDKRTLNERRAEFVYDGARLAAIGSQAPVVPVPWVEREQAFRDQFLKVIHFARRIARQLDAGLLRDGLDVRGSVRQGKEDSS
jgi:hypothetical protein